MGFKDAGKPHYLGHRERLRRRFREAGADALPDYELLEMILFRAVPRRDTKPLAKAILAHFGSFTEALNAPEERLKEVPGLGDYDEVVRESETHEVYGVSVRVLSLDGLIASKKAAGRPKDQVHLLELEELKKLKP